MPNITIYRTYNEVTNGFSRDVAYVFDRIANGKSAELISQIRTSKSKDERTALKKKLPAINFQGTFKERNAKGLQEFSGLMPLDYDNFPNEQELAATRAKLMKDPYTYALFTSPSGNGLKVIVKVPEDGAKNYKGYFDSLKEYYNNPYFDVSCSDVSRLCFESYDPELYVNDSALVYTESIEPEYTELGTSTPIFAITSDNRIIQNLLTWWRKRYTQGRGTRNTNLFKLAMALNAFGVSQREALNTLLEFVEVDFTPDEVTSICASAYKKTEVFGTRFFEDVETKFRVEKQIRVGKQTKDIAKIIPDVTEAQIEQAAEQIRDNQNVEDFWYFDTNGNIRLSPHKYKFWLEHNKFSKFFPTESKTYTFIQVNEAVVEETNEKRIKDYVLDVLLRNDSGYKPYDFMASSSKYFTPDFLSMLNSADIKIEEDTQDACYLYFRNCVVKITADNIEQIDYINLEGKVWKNQIIDRDYIPCDHHGAEYRTFIWHIAGQDEKRYKTFQSVIGYLLHSYKTSANNRAVILNDSVISENPNGGSGKGIFCEALKKLKKVSSIDGKTFDFNKSFPYQTVSTDCQLLLFDDVKRNFEFERLFSLITEGITIEYKGQDAIKLPVQRSPKIIISTNYTIGGVGGSFERRKFEVEFSDFFNHKHTPEMFFGHLLFDGWSETEWAKFDAYMMQCSQIYLRYGLMKSDFTNIETRKFIKQTSHDFWLWTQNHDVIQFNTRISKAEPYNAFLEDFQDYKKWLRHNTFMKWIQEYANFYGFEYKEGRHGIIGRYFVLMKDGEKLHESEHEQSMF